MKAYLPVPLCLIVASFLADVLACFALSPGLVLVPRVVTAGDP
jgi:hypothetical protein